MPLLTDFLPTTKKELELRGWDYVDVIIFSADAYVDHPSFGAAVIGRTLESEGYRVAIVPQPDWHGDYRDFKKLGKPRLYFAVAPGCMDSMVNKYTANRRLRSEDAYSPDGRHDCRPEYPTIVYTKILKELYPDVPVVLGGIEASLRRVTHYDYWQDSLRRCILCDSGADIITYGMGERVTKELTHLMAEGKSINEITALPQTVFLCNSKEDIPGGITKEDIVLHSHEECLKNKRLQAENIRHIEEESNRLCAQRILQQVGNQYVVVNPPFPTMTTEELDKSHALPYTRLPHPKYKGKRIPAYEMIKFSVNIHRGCFGGCSFCALTYHQGRQVRSRSKESIVNEVKRLTQKEDFKGYIHDVGGPTANFRGPGCKKQLKSGVCTHRDCLYPAVCPNMTPDHSEYLDLLRAVRAVDGVKKVFIRSGIRYDYLVADPHCDAFIDELCRYHISGTLKVAPEHISERVLHYMRKPSKKVFLDFDKRYKAANKRLGKKQYLIPYLISSHPGSTLEDAVELAVFLKEYGFVPDQVQDFYPTPGTLSTCMYYTELDPLTMKPVYVAKNMEEKRMQRALIHYNKKENRDLVMKALKKAGKVDLAGYLLYNTK